VSAFFFGPMARVNAVAPFDRTDRQAKATSQRQLAFKSPPMDEAEKRRLADELRAQKAREYGVDGLFQ
jgi:hypothetical protein